MATITSREVDVHPGPSNVRPIPRLGPASTSVGERVPAVVLSFTPMSVPPVPVTMGEGVPAVTSSTPPECPQTLAWGDAGDSSVPLSPNRVQAAPSGVVCIFLQPVRRYVVGV